jgi:RNA polymerase sigma factor (sigma-70 family)
MTTAIDENNLVKSYLPQIKAIARRLCPHDAAKQEDLTQIGSIQLLKAARTWREGDQGVFTYAYPMIFHDMRKHLRREFRLQRPTISLSEPIHTSEEGDEIVLEDMIGVPPEQEPTIATENQTVNVDRALCGLSPRQEHVIRLLYGVGESRAHTVREVAEALGLSKARIGQIEKDALVKLRKAIKHTNELAELRPDPAEKRTPVLKREAA